MINSFIFIKKYLYKFIIKNKIKNLFYLKRKFQFYE